MDEEKRQNEEVEEVDSIDENELKDIIKEAIKESQKENRKVILSNEMLDQLVAERMSMIENTRIEYENRKALARGKYIQFEGRKKILKMLEDECDRCLLEMCSIKDTSSEEYKNAYNNYRNVRDSYEEVRNNPFHKIDWTKVTTTLIVIGAAGALVFLLLLVENSPFFPRSKNALNMIMNLAKVAIKV